MDLLSTPGAPAEVVAVGSRAGLGNRAPLLAAAAHGPRTVARVAGDDVRPALPLLPR